MSIYVFWYTMDMLGIYKKIFSMWIDCSSLIYLKSFHISQLKTIIEVSHIKTQLVSSNRRTFAKTCHITKDVHNNNMESTLTQKLPSHIQHTLGVDARNCRTNERLKKTAELDNTTTSRTDSSILLGDHQKQCQMQNDIMCLLVCQPFSHMCVCVCVLGDVCALAILRDESPRPRQKMNVDGV